MKKALVFLAMVMFVIIGCDTGVVPPGTVVIIAKTNGDTKTVSSGKYTSWGRDRLYFVDMKLKSFTEKMKILCADDINMDVDVKWLGSFDVSKETMEVIKNKVPSAKKEIDGNKVHVLSLDEFYKIAMKDVIRSNSRKKIQPYITDNIPRNREQIESAVQAVVIEKFTDMGLPVKTTAVMLSNVDYPKEVTDQRKAIKNAMLEDEKQAALAEAKIAKALRDEEIARWQGKAQIVKAKTEAAENMIKSASITPAILANKQWETLNNMSQGPNNQVFVLPYEALKNTGITAGVLNKQALDKLISETSPLTEEQKRAKAEEIKKLANMFKKDAAKRKEKFQEEVKK
jgi:regulator of protease activity HflC (stomatin/prohibitin superfamily)